MTRLASTTRHDDAVDPSTRGRLWPLWGALAGLLGLLSTVGFDVRAGDTSDITYTVTAADMADLDHELLRVGGTTGYFCVGALLVFAAVWHRCVAQEFPRSLAAPVVTYSV